MMTLERAADFVSSLREKKEMDGGKADDTAAQDLFAFFVEYFGLRDKVLVEFAHLCGYPVAHNLRIRA